MDPITFLVNRFIQFLTAIIFRMDSAELKKVPATGPILMVFNHVNSIEVPVVRVRLDPRPVIGLAKRESWDNPLFNFLFNRWGGIPIRRGEADLEAFKKSVDVLKEGKILVVSPEGTRSHDGRLQKGFPGVSLLAVRSGAPILPVVFWGNENFWDNIKRLRRTDFKIRVGHPFKIKDNGKGLNKEVRQQMVDEIMYQMAALLPEYYRGVYADLSSATQEYLEFESGVPSNLPTASQSL
jgi:1-acyl-sn-glycerol-3-phosphate acyltransferase